MSHGSSDTVSGSYAMRGGWLVSAVGACVGLAIMGDSLLYSILPLAAPGLGISLPLVGVLLSANRLVRLVSNAQAGHLYERFGPRLPFLGAVVFGIVATLLYGVASGFLLFLLARLLWGIAWSGLRQGGYQAVWTGPDHHKGRLTGLLWGMVRLGSAIGVLLGGLLFDRYGYGAAIGMVIVAAFLALPVGLYLRWPTVEPHQPPRRSSPKATEPAGAEPAVKESTLGSWLSILKHPLRRWLTVSTFFQFLLSGVVISTTALFVAERTGNSSSDGVLWLGLGVATLTGVMHGVRWSTDLALGPLIGLFSDRIGQSTTALLVTVALVIAMAGALLLPPIPAILCLFVVLVGDGALHVVIAAAGAGAAIDTERPHAFIGLFTTLSDAGSALGPLMAFSLVEAVGLPLVYSSIGALLLLSVGQYWRWARA